LCVLILQGGGGGGGGGGGDDDDVWSYNSTTIQCNVNVCIAVILMTE
jgi:hypothetical protein